MCTQLHARPGPPTVTAEHQPSGERLPVESAAEMIEVAHLRRESTRLAQRRPASSSDDDTRSFDPAVPTVSAACVVIECQSAGELPLDPQNVAEGTLVAEGTPVAASWT